jgi:hypothetical protein
MVGVRIQSRNKPEDEHEWCITVDAQREELWQSRMGNARNGEIPHAERILAVVGSASISCWH